MPSLFAALADFRSRVETIMTEDEALFILGGSPTATNADLLTRCFNVNEIDQRSNGIIMATMVLIDVAKAKVEARSPNSGNEE